MEHFIAYGWGNSQLLKKLEDIADIQKKFRSTPLPWCHSTPAQVDGPDLFQADSSPKFPHFTRLLLTDFIPNIYSFLVLSTQKTHLTNHLTHIHRAFSFSSFLREDQRLIQIFVLELRYLLLYSIYAILFSHSLCLV